MLKLFRRIRLKLINQQELRKYFIYAAGEIILVVIGILLALQINDWSQANKSRQKEIKLLKEIHADLNATEQDFMNVFNGSENLIKSKDVVSKYFEEGQVWHDSLQKYFNRFFMFYNYAIKQTAFNSLENWGVDNLSNDTLRTQLMSLFGKGGTVDYLKRLDTSEEALLYGTYQDLIAQVMNFDNIYKIVPYENGAERLKEEYVRKEKLHKAILIYDLQIRKSILETIRQLKENVAKEIARLDE